MKDFAGTDSRPATSLMPDCGGAIRRLAMTILPSHHPRYDPARAACAEAFIRTLGKGTVLVALTEEDAAAEIANRLEELALDCKFEISATAPPSLKTNRAKGDRLTTVWLQDRFLVATLPDGQTIYLIAKNARQLNENQGAWLALHTGSAVWSPDHCPDGGNCLVGPDFWLLNTGVFLYVDVLDKIVEVKDALTRFDSRRLQFVGFALVEIAQSSFARRHETEESGSVTAYRSLDTGTVHVPQPGKGSDKSRQIQESKPSPIKLYDGDLFHLDILITVTGAKTPDGRNIIVFGRPLSTLGLVRDWRDDRAWSRDSDSFARRAWRLKENLRQRGFCVVMNPVPILPIRTPGRELRRIRAYNNVLLQNSPTPTVWLPQFADSEPELQPYDDENARIWEEELAFTVIRLRGFTAFAADDGAVRCMTKVLERDPWDGVHVIAHNKLDAA